MTRVRAAAARSTKSAAAEMSNQIVVKFDKERGCRWRSLSCFTGNCLKIIRQSSTYLIKN